MHGDPHSSPPGDEPSPDADFLTHCRDIATTARSVERSSDARRAWRSLEPSATVGHLRVLLGALDAEMTEARSWGEFGGTSPELPHAVRREIEDETIAAIARMNKIRLEVLAAIRAAGENPYPGLTRPAHDEAGPDSRRHVTPSKEHIRHGRKVEEARRHAAYLDEIGRHGWTAGNGLPASYQYFRRKRRKGRG